MEGDAHGVQAQPQRWTNCGLNEWIPNPLYWSHTSTEAEAPALSMTVMRVAPAPSG